MVVIINSKYQEAITLPSPRTAFRMTNQVTGEVITSVGEGLLVDASWEFLSEGFVGEFPTWKLKTTFMYLGDKKSYVGDEFYCETGAYSQDNTGYTDLNWIPVGYFKVSEEGQTTDEIMKQISLVLYDRADRLNKKYVPIEFPLTGLELRNVIASQFDLQFSPTQKPLKFDDRIFASINVSLGQEITYKEVLRMYAQLNMANVYIDRTGYLCIKSVFDTQGIDAEVSNFDYDSFKQEVSYGPINSLIYSNKAQGDEQSYQEIESKDDESISGNGKTSLEFSNTIFIDPLSLEEQQIIIDDLFQVINGFSYTPFDLNYFARPDFDPYDLLPLRNMEGQMGHVPITTLTFNYNGGLIGSMKTKKLPETLPKSEIPNIFERINNAEIRVSRFENTITMIVQEIDEQGERLIQSEQSLEGFKQTVYTKDETNEYVNETITTAEEGITNKFSKAGGVNLIRNSSLYHGLPNSYDFWEGDILQKENPDAVSGKSLNLQAGIVKQNIKEISEGYVSLRFYFNKYGDGLDTKAQFQINQDIYDLVEDGVVELSFLASSGLIDLAFMTDTSNEFEIYDLMLNYGNEVYLPYQQSMGEFRSTNVEISERIKVESNTSNTLTYLGANGLEGYNKATGKLVFKQTDTGIVTTDLQADSANIGGLRIIRMTGTNQIWIVGS